VEQRLETDVCLMLGPVADADIQRFSLQTFGDGVARQFLDHDSDGRILPEKERNAIGKEAEIERVRGADTYGTRHVDRVLLELAEPLIDDSQCPRGIRQKRFACFRQHNPPGLALEQVLSKLFFKLTN